ncbi:MAG: glycosyltransferase [Bacteroidota bacterium]
MSEHIRRVLVVAYYFPPMGLSGVQRSSKFVKYLPEYGWHPTVLTVDGVGYYAQDPSLLEELSSPAVRIVRTGGAGPGRYLARGEAVRMPSERTRKWLSRLSDALFIPDNKIGWRRPALRRALALHAETPFDLIFCTAPPFTSFLIGRDLKERINRPLVFDYRDSWCDYPFRFYASPAHRMGHRALERSALRSSSHVVTTNRRVKESLLQRYPFLGYRDVDIIPQGYDPEDFEGLPVPVPGKREERPMTIAYAGVFWEDRRPDQLLHALAGILKERPGLRGRIRAVFLGTVREEHTRLMQRLGLGDVVEVTGYVPHRECISRLRKADLLWLVVGDEFSSPGKLYEYIGAGRSILGSAPEGFVRQTVLEAGGKVVEPGSVPQMRAALLEALARYERGELPVPAPGFRGRFDRRKLTGDLVRIFNGLFDPSA